MKKDDVYIGMLCSCSKGTGIVEWVDETAKHVYLSDISELATNNCHPYKVEIDDIDSWVDNSTMTMVTLK